MSEPKHPIITFAVNLGRFTEETVGPNTNSKSVNLLHPDMHDNSADRGRTNAANHQTQFSSHFPGLTAGENRKLADEGSFTAYGQRASYLKKVYTTGTNPLLSVTSETFDSA